MPVKFNPPENHYIQLDIEFATAYGVNEALMFAKLYRLMSQWQGFTDDSGARWVRLTYDEWGEELPFFSRNTIIRTLKSLADNQLILETVFSGRSKWYRVNGDYVNASTQNGQTHLPKMGSPSTQNGLLPRVLPNSIPKKESAPENETPKQQKPGPVTTAILEICKQDYEFVSKSPVSKKQLLVTAALLEKEKATADQVLDFERWRSLHHWTKNSAPSLHQVGALWGEYKHWIENGRKGNGATTNGNKKQHGGKQNGHNSNSSQPATRGSGRLLQQKPGFNPYTGETIYPDGRRVKSSVAS